MVDRYTKLTHFLSCIEENTNEETSQIVMREVFQHNGLPHSIISDQEPQFVSEFWKHLFKMLFRVLCAINKMIG